MFDWFTKKAKKEDLERVEVAVQTGFDGVKQDLSNISSWIKHLKEREEQYNDEISDIYDEIATVKSELENVKNIIDIIGNKRLFKQRQTVFNKQTAVGGVQTAVQTAVQTTFLSNFLDNLSISERAIVWILLNTDMKLSYEDLAAMMGKERATIRGQINSIKQKSEGLVKEVIEKNNKKRVYIPEEMKSALLKKAKVRVKRGKNKGKHIETS